MIKTVLYYKIIEENPHTKPVIAKPVTHSSAVAFQKASQSLPPAGGKEGEKYLSGCQCGIFALCAKIMRAADCNPFGRKIEDFSPVICIFSRAMWMPRCDKRGLSPEKIKLRSRSGGPPPPRRAMQGPAQAERLCFGAHFCAVPARRDPGIKKENQ